MSKINIKQKFISYIERTNLPVGPFEFEELLRDAFYTITPLDGIELDHKVHTSKILFWNYLKKK